MEPLLDRLLKHYGISKEEYERLSLAPSFQNIPLIGDHEMVGKAISKLKSIKEKGGKVLIYGDYDTDGVMSCSILLRTLREFGISAQGYLPSRYLDGYGLTAANVRKIAAKGYSLIFTCDNGVTAHEALKEAASLGLEVIILDHHDFDETYPNCPIIIHPKTLNYGEVPISAGYLSFVFSVALLNRRDEYLLTLGAISTISDMMPMKSYNREIVRLMLDILAKSKFKEIIYLTTRTIIDETVFQMEIVPKINSIGRLLKDSTINRLLQYFAEDFSNKERIAKWINEVNESRKELTREAVLDLEVGNEEAAIVIKTALPEGLNGLLASRLLNQYQKPVAVFSPTEADKDILVGSLRSPKGFNVLNALKEAKTPLLKKGGHALAGGATIRSSDFESFKKDFVFSALKNRFEPEKEEAIPLELSECNMKTYRLLASFSPFGLEWEAPTFLLSGLNPLTFTYVKGGKYLSVKLDESTKIFSFSLNEDSFAINEKVSLLLTFRRNEYKGRETLDLFAERAIN